MQPLKGMGMTDLWSVLYGRVLTHGPRPPENPDITPETAGDQIEKNDSNDNRIPFYNLRSAMDDVEQQKADQHL